MAPVLDLWDDPLEYATVCDRDCAALAAWHPDAVVPLLEEFLSELSGG